MKNIILIIFLGSILLIGCSIKANGPYRAIEANTTYLYTDSDWEVFEVNTTGKNRTDLKQNAKRKIILELIDSGYRGKKNINPIISDPKKLKSLDVSKVNIVSKILADRKCVQLYTKKINGEASKSNANLYNATYIVKVNLFNINNVIKKYYEEL